MAAALDFEHQMLAFLQDLVRIRSVNGQDPESEMAKRIAEQAAQLGLEACLLGPDPDRQNVLVEYGSGPSGFALLAHLDTVAPGPLEAWTHPPFEGQISGRRLVGRGAADNKAGIVCGLYSLAILRNGGWIAPSAGRAILAGLADEESGASSPIGARFLLDEDLLRAQAAIYTYASDVICIGHRGLMRVRLTARGRAVHSGSLEWTRGESGVNAATGLAAALTALEDAGLPSRPHPEYGQLDNHITPGTVVQGGDSPGMVPGWAEAILDLRLMPDLPVEEALAHLDEILDQVTAERPGLELSYDIQIDLPAAYISTDHPLADLARAHTRAILGEDWRVTAAGPANEGYMFIDAGIPTLPGFGPRGGNAHAPDEWVRIDDLAAMAAIYSGMMLDFFRATGEMSDD